MLVNTKDNTGHHSILKPKFRTNKRKLSHWTKYKTDFNNAIVNVHCTVNIIYRYIIIRERKVPDSDISEHGLGKGGSTLAAPTWTNKL